MLNKSFVSKKTKEISFTLENTKSTFKVYYSGIKNDWPLYQYNSTTSRNHYKPIKLELKFIVMIFNQFTLIA